MRRKSITIEDMHALAHSRNGECLSSIYVTMKSPLLWKCSEGHVWEAPPIYIHNGKWCRICANKVIPTLEDMQELARTRGGKCLSETYSQKLRWECVKGHQWEAKSYEVRKGRWCKLCSYEARKGSTRRVYTIADMKRMAEEKGGTCLSDTFINVRTQLSWECALGHQFRAFPYNVIQGYWCRICAGLEIDGMSEAAILASERGGKCLSEQYLNAREPLEWICKDGHVWKAPLNEVKRGRWCKKCWDLKQVVQYNPYAIAVDRGGKCLSPRYEHTNQMLEWECDQGHRWHAPIFRVLRGAWCKECFKEGRLQGIERFQFIAKYKRGECLSTTYTAGAPMDFRCHKGHLWKATSTEMLRGRWCPVCTYETGVQR